MIPLPASPDFEVSTIRHAEDTATIAASFRELMGLIRSSKWELPVRKVHEAFLRGGKEEAAPHKKKLPGILFSGTFIKRGAANLVRHSGLICVDLDELGDRVEGIKEQVSSDPHVLAVFRSPTGSGLKVVFRCNPDRPHEHSFVAALQYVEKTFALDVDTACRDVSRICFVSHDPEAFVADDATTLPYPEIPEAHHTPMDLPPIPGADLSPGDDYDLRGDWKALLKNHGWTEEGTHYWTRPDKRNGISASWDIIPGRFYVFSSSTSFEPNKVYKPWHLLAHLEYGGDYARTARELQRRGFGAPVKKQLPILPNPAPEPVASNDDWESESSPPKPASEIRPIISYAYPHDDDPSILLGKDDYLGKGGGMLFVSHAGAGKSSWIMDACMMWALGRAWMGIRCARPLRSLIIQAEDSDRYVGKIYSSFAHKNSLSPEQISQVGENCRIVRVKGVSGLLFMTKLRDLTEEWTPDLVIINPLYLYADGDISRSEYAQPFLLGLDHINRQEKFAYILIHHTGKPQAKGNNGKRAETEDWESAYMGFGSSYLANWPRCTALLEPVPATPGRFTIKLGKGGYNAGVTREVPQGAGTRQEIVTRIHIKHSEDRMPVNGHDKPVYYWEECDPPSEQDKTQPEKSHGRPEKYQYNDYRSVMPPHDSKGLPYSQLHAKLNTNGPIGKGAFTNVLKRWEREQNIEVVSVMGQPNLYRAAL